ncbi:MAG: SMC-Scp complex subunit ScpB [Chloroflexi bacterium]|nr:SMC-Scp complex subunit ScpB [Chloroflexota bacterium]
MLESLLFVSSGPAPLSRLAKALEISPAAVQTLLAQLEDAYHQRGLRLQWSDNAVRAHHRPGNQRGHRAFSGG